MSYWRFHLGIIWRLVLFAFLLSLFGAFDMARSQENRLMDIVEVDHLQRVCAAELRDYAMQLAACNTVIDLTEKGENRRASFDEPTKELYMSRLYRTRALMYFRYAKPNEGFKDLLKAMEAAPGDAENYVERGWQVSQHGYYRLAEIDYKKALTLKPDHMMAHWRLARAYDFMGDKAKAVWEYEKYLTLYTHEQKVARERIELLSKQPD